MNSNNNNTVYLHLLYTLITHIAMQYMHCDHLSLNY